ncbi:hypothetical protein ABBQ38_015046 [Trebouxia sp. C0009 RCD-2024]
MIIDRAKPAASLIAFLLQFLSQTDQTAVVIILCMYAQISTSTHELFSVCIDAKISDMYCTAFRHRAHIDCTVLVCLDSGRSAENSLHWHTAAVHCCCTFSMT